MDRNFCRTVVAFLSLLAWNCQTSLHGENRLNGISLTAADGPVLLVGSGPTNSVYHLQRTSDLQSWQEWLRVIPTDGAFRVQDSAPGPVASFYRFSTSIKTPADDWKNQASFPTDPFLAADEADQVRWMKFLILASDPTRVYFQDSTKYVLHYDFAKARFPKFAPLSRTDFDAVSLYLTDQQAILGSLLFPPGTNVLEFGIQFAGQDPYPTEWVTKYFPLVRQAVDAPAGSKAFYFPTFEQTQAAQMGETALKAQGIYLGSVYRWLSGDQVYASGWAVGHLRFFAATNIDTAYAEGRLRSTDILLTEAVPAHLPFVAGILSLAPATPNSHVALFAGANDLPFAYIDDRARQQQVRQWDGHEIVLRAGVRYGVSQVTVTDVEGQLDNSARAELLALKTPPRADILPKQRYGQISADTVALLPQDRQYFGGKAAPYGLLRRMVPANSEPAIAFSFDLWDAFMDQIIPQGTNSLHDIIQTRLARFTNYPPDISAVQTNLAAIRDLITGVATFTPDQKQAIIHALSPFDPSRKIRFRSSSNAEDSKSFVGAGLYTSYSGCLLDDLDSSNGPCQCDPTEPKKQSVFKAMRKVYASFYTDDGFLERLRHGIDESQVAMGILAHYSAPDDTELANGVAELSYEAQRMRPSLLTGSFVTQPGAESVTNPSGNAVPEVMRVTENGAEVPTQNSSLVPLGATVLSYPKDYTVLFALMKKCYTNYSALVGYKLPDGPLLDFEYKKRTNHWLQLKQVRELPQPGATLGDPFLVNEPTTYWVFNCEQTSAMADHRLKCLFTLRTRNARLDETNLARCFYTDARFEYRLGNAVQTLTGAPSSWPSASHSVTVSPSGRTVHDKWVVGSGPDQRTYVLTTTVPTVNLTDGLVITSRDLPKRLDVTYASPQPAPEGSATTEFVRLVMAPDPQTLSPGTPVVYQAGKLNVSMSFLLSSAATDAPPLGVDPNPYGAFPAYYSSWAHATITGLLNDPIVLDDYYATTGVPGHKERFKWYIFEPAADPSLLPGQRQALESANIKVIHIYWQARTGTNGTYAVTLLGTNGVFRSF